ncbi:MAG: hypothetical protein CM1200mP2_01000 [Planctomycetaceae bacterium]|nr:MAG: hypothetical protein CM1200mP2_01000 [Planctomycetaceae bacterium]
MAKPTSPIRTSPGLQAEQQERGENAFANPRNTCAGALKLLDPNLCAQRRVRFFAHSTGHIEGGEYRTHTEFLDAVARMGLPATPGVETRPDIISARSTPNPDGQHARAGF